ncbi:hypothetical protein [Roseovarius phycicola]|uniref:Uncharacterized protein n=1 Tax=Roseovarius phycicola TaxID=3080976 RepID=A0ABZ2HJF0_9RHOB
MTEALHAKKNERGIVRLFIVDTDAEGPNKMSAEPDWAADADDPPWPLRDALGVEYLDSDFIELFDVRDLDELGLAGYMIEGLGISEEDVTPHQAQLDAIKGLVLFVYSNALGGFEVTLRPTSPLRWVGTFVEDRPPMTFEPITSVAAQGDVTPEAKSRPSDAAMSGRVAMVALLVLFALTAVVIWVAS